MTVLKATKGPWSVGIGDSVIGGGYIIAEPYTDGTSGPLVNDTERQANAHLMAASRDLYEELQDARDTVQALIDDGYIGYVSQRDNIDSVLAGARGDV